MHNIWYLNPQVYKPDIVTYKKVECFFFGVTANDVHQQISTQLTLPGKSQTSKSRLKCNPGGQLCSSGTPLEQ